jgi:hypothetical protein
VRRSRFCIEMVDRNCHGPMPAMIEGSALLKAFELVPETDKEVADLAKEMEISESRTQQIEAAGRLTSRMSERYASAIKQILRRRKALADLLG